MADPANLDLSLLRIELSKRAPTTKDELFWFCREVIQVPCLHCGGSGQVAIPSPGVCPQCGGVGQHGFHWGRKAICANHSAPLDIFAEIYFSQIRHMLLIAPRNGGKTQMLTLLALLKMHFSQFTISHMGAVESQAHRARDYLHKLLGIAPWSDDVKGQLNQGNATFHNGAGIEWLTGTLNQACLPGTTGIITDQGTLRLKDIVRKKLPVRVKSYNFGRQQWEWQPVVGWHDHGPEEQYYALALVDRTSWRDLTATANHLIMQPDGTKVPIASLKTGDRVCRPGFVPSKDQQQVVLGLLLGDGTIDKWGRLSVSHGRNQRDYLEWIVDALKEFGPTVRQVQGGYGTWCWDVRFQAHPWMRELRRTWYPDGKKRIPGDALSQLRTLGLAIWIMDDGTFRDGYYCCIATDALDESQRHLVEQYFTSQGLDGGFSIRKKNGHGTWHFIAKSSRTVMEIIADYLEVLDESLIGRKRWRHSTIQHGKEGIVAVEIGSVLPVTLRGRTTRNHGFRSDKPERRYDLTVAENHNYCVGSGILVSNSGGHPVLAILDEADMVDPSVRQRFMKTPSGPSAMFVEASTHYIQQGTISQILKETPNLPVRRYCMFESLQQCEYDCDRMPQMDGSLGKCAFYETVEYDSAGRMHIVPLCAGKIARECDGHNNVVTEQLNFAKADLWSRRTEYLCETPDRPVGGRAYWSFHPSDNRLLFDPEIRADAPLEWFLDFNPGVGMLMCSGIIQQQRDGSYAIIDEIVLKTSSTLEVTREFLRRYGLGGSLVDSHAGGVWVYGDRGGHNRNSTTGQTDYDLIVSMLRNTPGFRLMIPAGAANPPLVDRLNLVNKLLCDEHGYRALRVAPRCTETMRELEMMPLGADRQKDKSDRIQRALGLSHLGDGLEYWAWSRFGRAGVVSGNSPRTGPVVIVGSTRRASAEGRSIGRRTSMERS